MCSCALGTFLSWPSAEPDAISQLRTFNKCSKGGIDDGIIASAAGEVPVRCLTPRSLIHPWSCLLGWGGAPPAWQPYPGKFSSADEELVPCHAFFTSQEPTSGTPALSASQPRSALTMVLPYIATNTNHGLIRTENSKPGTGNQGLKRKEYAPASAPYTKPLLYISAFHQSTDHSLRTSSWQSKGLPGHKHNKWKTERGESYSRDGQASTCCVPSANPTQSTRRKSLEFSQLFPSLRFSSPAVPRIRRYLGQAITFLHHRH